MSCDYRVRRPSGVTAIEVLISIAVLGILSSLILPAIQRARAAAQRTACASNLRQLIAAAQDHVAAQRVYPPYLIGVIRQVPGDMTSTSRIRNLSGHVAMLPYLDQMAIYDRVDVDEEGQHAVAQPPQSTRNAALLSLSVPLFECPADDVPAGGNSYRGCQNTGPDRHAIAPFRDERNPKFGAFGAGRRITPARIVDGLSQTAFFSERLVGDGNEATYTPCRDAYRAAAPDGFRFPDEAAAACAAQATWTPSQHYSHNGYAWLFTESSQTLYNHVLPPNSRVPDCWNYWNSANTFSGAATARSFHDGGVNLALGDGAVRFVADSIDVGVWRSLASINGEEIVSGNSF